MKNTYIILDNAEYHRVTVRSLPAMTRLEYTPNCPCCDVILEVVCALVSEEGKLQLRIGVCPECGTTGYIDRPHHEWIESFYKDVWDSHIALNHTQVEKFPRIEDDKKSSRRIVALAASSLPIQQRRSVLEIGVGYGNVLRHLKDAQSETIVGVEHSRHRSEMVSAVLNVPVITGPFESSDVQSRLSSFGYFDVILRHHVFEHVVQPRLFIEKVAHLQNEGGFLILAMPDGDGEHVGYQTFYPPHLYSYTKFGVAKLLQRYGYSIIEDLSPSRDNMIVMAQKGSSSKAIQWPQPSDVVAKSISKFSKGLGFFGEEVTRLHYAQWLVPHRGYHDFTRTPGSWTGWILKKLSLRFAAFMGRHTSSHVYLFGPSFVRYTTAPLELQWRGVMRLLFK